MLQAPIYQNASISLEIFSSFIFILKKHIDSRYLVEGIKGLHEFVPI